MRGIAGELVAAEVQLPGGLKVPRRVPSDSKASTSDYELRTHDGGLAELEVKAQRPENWPSLLDEYDAAPTGAKQGQIAILVKQVEVGNARKRKVYVAVTDGMSKRSRERLPKILEPVAVKEEQLIFLPESEILRVSRALREHMKIPQPKPPGKASAQGGGE